MRTDGVGTSQDFNSSRFSAITFLILEGFASLSIAVAIFAIDVWVFKVTGRYDVFATLALLAALPSVIISPLAGPIIDHIPRGTTILLCSGTGLGAGIGSAIFADLSGFSVVAAGMLMLTLALIQTVRWPTLLATVSLLSPPREIERITAYEESVEAGITVAAPLIGAAIMQQFGIDMVFSLAFIPFIGSIFGVFFLKLPRAFTLNDLRMIIRDYTSNFKSRVLFGFQWISSRKNILHLLIYICILNFGATIFVTMQVPLALTLFSANKVAIIMACGGVGLICGSIVVSVFGNFNPLEKAVYLGSSGITLGIAIYSVSMSFLQSAIGTFVFLFFHPFVNTAVQVLWRNNTPKEHQGAIFSVRRMFTSALAPLAIALSVPISQHIAIPAWKNLSLLAPGLTIWSTATSSALGFTLVLVAITTWALIILFRVNRFLEAQSSVPE
jgi:MFS family permease